MTDFLLLAFTLLVAGVIAVPLASRFGLGSVLGYLIAGVVIGPLLRLLGVDVVAIQHFAEFGVVMMLFLVGLELEPRLLWQMRGRLLGLGGLQVAGTTAVVMAAAMLLGLNWSVALAIGLVLALSSTAIVLQTLNEKGLMKCDGGQASFSVLLFQDIAVIPMLALLPLLALPEFANLAPVAAEHGTTISAEAADAGHAAGMSLVTGLSGWQTALVNLVAIAAVIVIGGVLTGPLFRFIARARLRELFTAGALTIVIGIALLMSLVGLSPALGTFIAGVVLANSEYRHELESDIDPFRGLLLGLFFITVGAGIDFNLLMANPQTILGLAVALMVAKVAVLLVLGRLFNVQGADKWLLALGLAQAGEFGFVLLSFTVANGVIPADLAAQLSLIVAISMLVTPLLFILYDRVIVPYMQVGNERKPDVIDRQEAILVAGHGRFGGMINRMLRAAGHETTVLDYSSEHLDVLRAYGMEVYFGDATRPDLLQAAGIENAKMLVVAINERDKITQLVRYAVKAHPNLHIVARAYDRHHVYELWAAGCRDIIRETYDSSIRAGRSALEAMGATKEEAVCFAQEFEARDRASMVDVADLYDPDIPGHQNPAYVAKIREMVKKQEAELRGQLQEFRQRAAAKS